MQFSCNTVGTIGNIFGQIFDHVAVSIENPFVVSSRDQRPVVLILHIQIRLQSDIQITAIGDKCIYSGDIFLRFDQNPPLTVFLYCRNPHNLHIICDFISRII